MCVGPLKAAKIAKTPTPKAPPLPPEVLTPPVQPTKDDPQVNADASAKRKRLLARKGSGSNVLTGPLGDIEEANIASKSLLG